MNLLRCYAVMFLNLAEHSRQAVAPETTTINQSPVMFDAKAPSEFRVRVPDSKFLGELSVGNQMF